MSLTALGNTPPIVPPALFHLLPNDNGCRSNNTSRTGYHGYCQWCGTQGYSAKRFLHVQFGSQNLPVMNPTTHGRSSSYPAWLLDSGASHHVTSDSANLPGVSYYDGPVDNGSGLGITHVHSSFLPSPSSKSFHLSNVLSIPSTTKYIISISKFNKKNNTYIELFHVSFLVKDLNTSMVLLRGPRKDDVYEWSSQSLR